MKGSNRDPISWTHAIFRAWPVLGLWILLQCFVSTTAFAQETDEVCNIALQKKAYSQYLTSIDGERVKRTQRELNQVSAKIQLAFGEVIVDGVLGTETREALYQYCRQLKSVTEGNFIINLVMKLDQQTALMAAVENTINANEVVAEKPFSVEKIVTTSTVAVVVGDNIKPVETLTLKNDPAVWYLLDEAGLASLMEKNKPPSVLAVDENRDKEKNSVIAESTKSAVIIPSGETLAKLELLFEIPFVNRSQFIQAVLVTAGIDKANSPEFIDELTNVAKKVASSKLEPIVISDNDCGCVREFSSTVYGFYPYWRSTVTRLGMESEEQQAASELVRVIDYSVVNRIAYYGLTLDESGQINTPRHWGANGKLGNFINKAHRHKTAVDLAIYSGHWSQWTESTMQASVMSVYNQLMLQVEYKQSGVKGYVPFINSTVASADGVTLHFDNFFDNPSARYKIVEFIGQLYERLDDLERDYKINILLNVGLSELKKKQRLLHGLKSLLVSDASGVPAYVDSLLLFIDKPTTDTKKLLRSKIEDEFSGAQRMEVLRKIIPVISPHGHENDERGSYTQFDDDLIYFKNNFSGVGLWPLPLATDKDMPEVTKRLIELFGAGQIEGLLNTISDRYPALCEFACPNRWAFRLGLDLLLLLAAGFGLLAIFSRRLRHFYSRNATCFILYIVVMALVFLVSLTCDPFWKQKRDIVLLGLLLMTAAIFMIRKYSQVKQGPLP